MTELCDRVSQTFLTFLTVIITDIAVRCSKSAKHLELKREFGAGDPGRGSDPKPPPRLCKRFGFVTCHWETGKVTDQHAASQETGLQDVPTPLSGVTGLGE